MEKYPISKQGENNIFLSRGQKYNNKDIINGVTGKEKLFHHSQISFRRGRGGIEAYKALLVQE